tara:strand:- start:306 stop:548 length:243 start_codon:yes stop_codon:yes gene_type:complete
MRIIYKHANGEITLLTPTPDILSQVNPSTGKLWTVDEVAKKDVPTGSKYKIVEDTDVPTDRSFRDAWTVDESDLTDGVGE